MKVKELIEILKDMPQELDVYVGANYEYYGISMVTVDNNKEDVKYHHTDYEEWVTIE